MQILWAARDSGEWRLIENKAKFVRVFTCYGNSTNCANFLLLSSRSCSNVRDMSLWPLWSWRWRLRPLRYFGLEWIGSRQSGRRAEMDALMLLKRWGWRKFEQKDWDGKIQYDRFLITANADKCSRARCCLRQRWDWKEQIVSLTNRGIGQKCRWVR